MLTGIVSGPRFLVFLGKVPVAQYFTREFLKNHLQRLPYCYVVQGGGEVRTGRGQTAADASPDTICPASERDMVARRISENFRCVEDDPQRAACTVNVVEAKILKRRVADSDIEDIGGNTLLPDDKSSVRTLAHPHPYRDQQLTEFPRYNAAQ